MFFVGADPPLSLDLSAGRKQPLAVVFHPFCAFFRHFHLDNLTYPTWTKIFSNSFPTISVVTWPPLGKQMATYVSQRTSILLLPPNSVQSLHTNAPNPLGESKPTIGPSLSVNLTFGMLNSRSVVNT